MLTDKSYFLGLLTVPQLGQVAVLKNLNTFIERFEPEILQAALGYDLYRALMDAVEEAAESSADPLLEKWDNLLNGCVFTTQMGIKKQWKGISNYTTKHSITAPAIWAEWLRDQQVQITGIGAAVPESENATRQDPSQKIATAWFYLRQDVNILWELLMARKDVYTEYSFSQINYGYFGPQNSFNI